MYNGIVYTNDPESVAISIPGEWVDENWKDWKYTERFFCTLIGHGRASDIPSVQSTDTDELIEVKERVMELIGNFSMIPESPQLWMFNHVYLKN